MRRTVSIRLVTTDNSRVQQGLCKSAKCGRSGSGCSTPERGVGFRVDGGFLPRARHGTARRERRREIHNNHRGPRLRKLLTPLRVHVSAPHSQSQRGSCDGLRPVPSGYLIRPEWAHCLIDRECAQGRLSTPAARDTAEMGHRHIEVDTRVGRAAIPMPSGGQPGARAELWRKSPRNSGGWPITASSCAAERRSVCSTGGRAL